MQNLRTAVRAMQKESFLLSAPLAMGRSLGAAARPRPGFLREATRADRIFERAGYFAVPAGALWYLLNKTKSDRPQYRPPQPNTFPHRPYEPR